MDGGLQALGEALHAGPVGASLRTLKLTEGEKRRVGEEAVASFLETLFRPPSPVDAPACCGALTLLDLGSMPLSAAGVVRMATAISTCEGSGVLHRLEKLSMVGTAMGDMELTLLSAALAKQCPGLQELNLRGQGNYKTRSTSTHMGGTRTEGGILRKGPQDQERRAGS